MLIEITTSSGNNNPIEVIFLKDLLTILQPPLRLVKLVTSPLIVWEINYCTLLFQFYLSKNMRYYLVFLFLFSSCSIFNFDNLEYDYIITIKLTADTNKKYCPTISDENITLLKTQIQHLNYYAKYRGGTQVYESAIMLNEIAEGLNNNMSKFYCVKKLDNISEVAERIAETLGKL